MADIHTCSYACDNPPCIKAQRDELLPRIDALTADAERYRWLRDCDGDQEDMVMLRMSYFGKDELLSGEELDAAIDAARQQEAARGR